MLNKRSLGLILICLFGLCLAGCQSADTKDADEVDFLTWDQVKLYAFLDEVATYNNEINNKTYTDKNEIVKQYEKHFTLELSQKIVDGIFVEKDNQFKIIEGDPGYILIRPSSDNSEGQQVDLKFEKEYISMIVTYQIGLYSKIEYHIENQDGIKITKWEFQ